MALDPERRRQLLDAKLRALVAGRWGDAPRETSTFPGGAALVEGATGWVHPDPDGDPARVLGPALVWADRHHLDTLHVVVDGDAAGHLARVAAEFRFPIHVWRTAGRSLAEAEPVPPAPDPPVPPDAARHAGAIRAAGADPVVERGVLLGEVEGLEVARVVTDPDGAWLEVGVGKHDRHAQSLLHGDRPPADALAEAVRFVAAHRRRGAEPHPLNRLARERWLRAELVRHPELVGAAELQPVSSPVVRDDLRKPAPAPAAGVTTSGEPLVVVCSTGIDLDLVPQAADARLRDGRDAQLLLVVPPRDDHPITRRLAGLLRRPAAVVALDPIA